MTHRDARHPLPEWITESAPSMFGAVKTVYLDHRNDQMGVSLYGGGADKVIRQLPALSRVVIDTTQVTYAPYDTAIVPLLMSCLKHLDVEGGGLDLFVNVYLSGSPTHMPQVFYIPVSHWQTVGEESDELLAVVRGRVRSVIVGVHVLHDPPRYEYPPALPSLSSSASSFSSTAWDVLTRFDTIESVVLTMARGVTCDRYMLSVCVQDLVRVFPGRVGVEQVGGDPSLVFRRQGRLTVGRACERRASCSMLGSGVAVR
mmetsp:Transcript_20055/g.48679  ORF Transcript_20055/g.48679 Transcript_20055/m.48679 type:complete len:258 (-) Transcript_20055:48-821(-)